jgi:hypothetical protein
MRRGYYHRNAMIKTGRKQLSDNLPGSNETAKKNTPRAAGCFSN